MSNEHRANQDSVLIRTSTAQPGGGWWVVCHSPVQTQLMGTTQPLLRGDFRQHQEQVLQAASLHIKAAPPHCLSCVTLIFRVTDGWWDDHFRFHGPAREDEFERGVTASICAAS